MPTKNIDTDYAVICDSQAEFDILMASFVKRGAYASGHIYDKKDKWAYGIINGLIRSGDRLYFSQYRMTLLQFEDWQRPVNVGAIPNIQTMIVDGEPRKYLSSPYSMGAVDLRPGYSPILNQSWGLHESCYGVSEKLSRIVFPKVL